MADFFRRLLASVAAPAPTPKPQPPAVDQLLQRLVAETQPRQPVPAAATGSTVLETLLRNLLSGNLGWTAEKVGGGYAMISPRVAAERRQAENGD